MTQDSIYVDPPSVVEYGVDNLSQSAVGTMNTFTDNGLEGREIFIHKASG